MSYSFSWDCTLPINNIQDIISINIEPQTKTYSEDNYLSLRGDICIEGEYLAHNKAQHIFAEKIPLDITLPNNREADKISTEVVNFDYEVRNGEMLFLKVDLVLTGYELEEDVDVEKETCELDRDDSDQDKLKELVLDEPLVDIEFNNTSLDYGKETLEPGEETEKRKENQLKPNQVVESVTETVVGVAEKLKPSNMVETVVEVTDVITDTVAGVAEKLKPSHMVETVIEVTDAVTDTVMGVAEKLKPSHMVETVVEVKDVVTETVTGEAGKFKPSQIKESKVRDVEVKEDIVKTYKTKKTIREDVVEDSQGSDTTTANGNTALTKNKNLFNMLYDLDTNFNEDEVHGYETVSQREEIIESESIHEIKEEEVADTEETESSIFNDSVASQFPDGASIIKIIFIQEEANIADICKQYEVSEQAIFNLETLASPLKSGDRVMINYGRVQ